MAGEKEKLFSLAGRVYVLLRRQTDRMIDVEWAIANADYAREVVRLARGSGLAELVELAAHMEEIHPLWPAEKKAGPMLNATATEPKYVAHLR